MTNSLITLTDQKYKNRIMELYGDYIPDYNKEYDMPEHTTILPDWKYNLRFSSKTRAITLESSGNIYLKESTASEYVLVHEYIHRLSRNPVPVFLGLKHYQIGIATMRNGIHLVGLNELLTEWCALQVTGPEPADGLKHNIYHGYLDKYHSFFENKDLQKDFLPAFFAGKEVPIVDLLYQHYKKTYQGIQAELNTLSENVINRKPCSDSSEFR